MPTILSIDDERANQVLIQQSLKDDFTVELASNGLEAVACIEQQRPDLVLLDVNMPEPNGIDTCHRIRELAGIEELPIIFVSAFTDIEDKLKGYEAGGNDYICKPIVIPELHSKIRVLLEQRDKFQQSQTTLQTTRHAMMSAISYAGELGSIIQFFEEGFRCQDHSELADVIFSVGTQLGLSLSIQFRTESGPLTLTQRGVCSPLEEELLTQSQYADRIVSFRRKALYNAPTLSILARNMPIEDEELCGRIRDHLAIILHACEAQIDLITARRRARRNRNQEIDSLFSTVISDFSILSEMLDQYQNRMEENLEEFRIDFEETAATCDIQAQQVSTLMESLDRLFDANYVSRKQREVIERVTMEIAGKIAAIKED